jgi:alanine racemase
LVTWATSHPMRPTWVEVSLPALRRNYRVLQGLVAPAATVSAVVKADAYGHGALKCARALERDGANWFCVTSPEEGIALREGRVRGRILLLSGFWRGEEEEVLLRNLTPAVWQPWHIEVLEAAAVRLCHENPVRVHLKLDTGMARLGLMPAELPAFLAALQRAPHVRLEGVLSHLASSEVFDDPANQNQLERFDAALATIRAAGIEPTYCHIANTAAALTGERSWHNMVRTGLALYGYHLPLISCAAVQRSAPVTVEPVLAWKTRLIEIKEVGAGQPVGYGGAFVTQAPSRLAILPVGYADGFSRLFSCRGRVIVRARYAPIAGNVSMDLTAIDITNVPQAHLGDEVTLLGSCGPCSITAWEHAELSMTIPYEVLCSIGRRVPRVYLD